MKWCCAQFGNHFAEAGLRGFAVFAVMRDFDEPAFLLQHRSLDPNVEPVPQTGPFSVVSDVGIMFCPWCGVRLRDYYRKSMKELDRSDLEVPL
jgi:hypothetical protein